MTQNGFDFSDQLIKETFVSEAMAYSKPAKALGMKTVWINQGFAPCRKRFYSYRKKALFRVILLVRKKNENISYK